MYLGEIMTTTNISKVLNVDVFDQNDYFNSQKEVDEILQKVLKSYKDGATTFDLYDAKEYLENLNSELFLQKLSAKICVLCEHKSPVAFAIFVSSDGLTCRLDQIWTKKDYLRFGLATILLRECALIAKGEGLKNIIASTKKGQETAQDLFDSFGKSAEV